MKKQVSAVDVAKSAVRTSLIRFVAVSVPILGLLLLSLKASVVQGPSATPLGSETGAHIFMRDAQTLSVTHVGAPAAVEALNSGQAKPLSLAKTDFNGDGVSDLVAGFGTTDGSGILEFYSGNLDAFAPQSYNSWRDIGEGRFPSPFLDSATALYLPAPPDFLAAGNFTSPNHVDVVAAARGDNTLYLVSGDGQGNFASTQPISLAGPLTAMAGGRFGATNLASTIIAGIGGSNPSLAVYSVMEQRLSLASQFPLPSPATCIVMNGDDMDKDGLPDAVLVAAGQVMILHAAWGASGKPGLEMLSLPISAVSVTTGYFLHDRHWGRQMAVLDKEGEVIIVASGAFDPRSWTVEEVRAMRDAMIHHQPNPFRRTGSGPANEGWKVVETLPGMGAGGSGGSPALLLPAQLSGKGLHDIVVIDSRAGRLTMASHPPVALGATSFTPANISTRLYSGTPVTALSMRVNADAREGLVVMHEGETTPLVMMPETAAHSDAAPQAPKGAQ